MGISIKKDKKTVKPKPKPKPKAKPKPKPQQKENQTQSQNVIVNVGSNGITARRRASTQTLQKNKVMNKQQTGPTQINVPQALPIQQQQSQQPMNEFIKYYKENERQKEMIKDKESTNSLINYLKETEKQKEIIKEKDQKINELEKDKKDKNRSKVLTPDEVQNDFSRVYNDSIISSITNSGTATPFFSRQVDPNELYDLLRKEADRRGGNPNSGNITFDTLQSNAPSSNSTLTTQSSDGIDQRFESTRETGKKANTTRNSIARLWLGKARQSIADRLSSQSNDLSTYMTQSPPKEPTEQKMQSKYQELFDTEIEAQQVEPPELVPVDEDPVIDEILREEPENQIVVFGSPQRNPIDNSIPPSIRPINEPLPAVYKEDIINNVSTPFYEKLNKRRANKPVLAIEPQSTQDEAEDTIRLLAGMLKPEPPPTPPKPKPPPPPASEPETTDENVVVTSSSVEGFDEFQRYITDKNNKELTNAKLAEILIRHNIKDPNTGKTFYIRTPDGTKKKIAMIHGNSNPVTKTILTELLLTNYKPGFVYK